MSFRAPRGRHHVTSRVNTGSVVKASTAIALSSGLVASANTALAVPTSEPAVHAATPSIPKTDPAPAVPNAENKPLSLNLPALPAAKSLAAPVVTTARTNTPAAQNTARANVARQSTTSTSRSGTRDSVAAPATTKKRPPKKPAATPNYAGGGIVGAARALTGIPYVWGGTSRGGADCSGYVQLVYRSVGISLPRTSQAQQAFTRRVANPQPGDLIFWGYPAYHVGIYAGNGMMYDSSQPGTVTSLRRVWGSPSYGRVG